MKTNSEIIKLALFCMSILLFACNSSKKYEIKDFNCFTNFKFEKDTLELQMDLKNVIYTGISIPSANQTPSSYFKFAFKLKNNTSKPQRYLYRIFYQNESYKFIEADSINELEINYNSLASENFYGSWDGLDDGFHLTSELPSNGEFYEIVDSFKIVGNPRNEQLYYGADDLNAVISKEDIDFKKAQIKSMKEWYDQIKKKAKAEKRTIDLQLELDAKWALSQDRQKGNINNRWKRNPRVGFYKTILVIYEEINLDKIPAAFKSLSTKDSTGVYVNPFYYLYNDAVNKSEGTLLVASQILKTYAKLDLASGIYVDPLKVENDVKIKEDYYNDLCGNLKSLAQNANFMQYFHYINKNYPLNNIPLVKDIMHESYTKQDYISNKNAYKDKILKGFASITDCPCKTVGYISEEKAMYLKNPGNNGTWKKENVGIQSRIGFTYGKFRAKIKFPPLLNKDSVWNGVTAAFWLLYQSDQEWNYRRPCSTGHFVPRSAMSEKYDPIFKSAYSEIDFEIVKASRYWPKTSYRNENDFLEEDASKDKNILVTSTNWDLACKDPKTNVLGIYNYKYNDQIYPIHRWNYWYQALTHKYAIHHDTLLTNAYWFEIDWQPEKIIWRIGKDKNSLKQICIMDTSFTIIPNNQMIMVFSQEFHDASWWPTTPYEQHFLPFPKNDIIGKVYEIEIE